MTRAGVLREDRSTTTVEDAGAYERARDNGWADFDDGRPSAADLGEMAADDAFTARRRREREDAARARGEYVPSPAMAALASALSMRLAQRGVLDATVTPVREGVLWADAGGIATCEGLVAALCDGDRRSYEFAAAEGGVWVRVLTNPLGDPFVVDGVAQDGPPF